MKFLLNSLFIISLSFCFNLLYAETKSFSLQCTGKSQFEIVGSPGVKEEIKTVLGNFAGMSLETISIKVSQEIFEILGFKNGAGNTDQGWLTMKNEDDFTISFMAPNSCPHLFFNPSLTYFNGKKGNPIVIQNIRDLDIPITEEITYFNRDQIVDNISLETQED